MPPEARVTISLDIGPDCQSDMAPEVRNRNHFQFALAKLREKVKLENWSHGDVHSYSARFDSDRCGYTATVEFVDYGAELPSVEDLTPEGSVEGRS